MKPTETKPKACKPKGTEKKQIEPKKRMSKTWEAMMMYKGGMTINDPAWLQ